MTKRHYQLFALFLLIGAPLLVSLLTSSLLPGIRQIAPAQTKPQVPEYMQPAPDPAAGLPPAQPEPPPSQAVQSGPQAGSAYVAGPSLDTGGMAISGTDPAPGGTAATYPSPQGSDNDGSGGLSEDEIIAKRSAGG